MRIKLVGFVGNEKQSVLMVPGNFLDQGMKRCFRIISILCAVSFADSGFSQSLVVVGWNVESGGANPLVLAQRVAAFNADILGFVEVQNEEWAESFETAATEARGGPYGYVLGSTGGADRLLILYDSERLDLLASFELQEITISAGGRAPLVGRMRYRSSDLEFLFMVDHLLRGSVSSRHVQARLLNAWAREQALPVIAVGVYHFDWAVDDGQADHDEGYDEMVAGGTFTWVRPPDPLVKSHCSTRYPSVLDFIFVAGAAQEWRGVSRILVAPGDCPDDGSTSDHRPVYAQFDIGAPPTSPRPTEVRALDPQVVARATERFMITDGSLTVLALVERIKSSAEKLEQESEAIRDHSFSRRAARAVQNLRDLSQDVGEAGDQLPPTRILSDAFQIYEALSSDLLIFGASDAPPTTPPSQSGPTLITVVVLSLTSVTAGLGAIAALYGMRSARHQAEKARVEAANARATLERQAPVRPSGDASGGSGEPRPTSGGPSGSSV